MGNVRGSMLAVAFCLLGAVHVVSTASLNDNEQRQRHYQDINQVDHQRHEQDPEQIVQHRTSAVELFLSLISEIARISATSELTRSANSGSTTFNNIFLPSPIKLEGGNTTLQLVLIPVPAVPSLSYIASVLTTPNVSPSNIGHSVINTNVHDNYMPSRPNIREPVSNHVYQETSSRVSRPTTQPPQPVKIEVNDDTVTQHHVSNEERRARNSPIFLPVEDSQQLLLQFRAQMPRTPSLPPVVTEPLVVNTADDEVVDVPDPVQKGQSAVNAPYVNSKEIEKCRHTCQESSNFGRTLDPVNAGQAPSSPPLPRFDRSLMVEAVLTVPRADYSEPYTLWWDAVSGESRIEHHGGTAFSYRSMHLDGHVHFVHVRVDRTGESDVRRCIILEPRRITLAERAIPVLPDLSGFKFAGYIDAKPIPGVMLSRVERWIQAISASNGESGAARGEVLTYRHELLVARTPDYLTTTPLRYAVAVDSSILGKNCDSYVHRFLKVYTRHHDSSTFSFDVVDACDSIEKTNQTELVEPLREFSLLLRDPKYDGMLSSKEKLCRMRDRVSKTFDWRKLGGVTHVRNQSMCASCWAFAVVGAVEGALFARTRRLIPLSEQSLLDCGHRSGTRGCEATWPSFAYDYVRDNGLPALDEYSPYVAKVQECSVDRVAPVTRISSHVNVTSRDITALKVAIRDAGPTVLLMNINTASFHSLKKGFYYDAKCTKKTANHAMLAVGWTVYRGETYFILKNSWGCGWGRDGYIYMRAKTNTCGLLRLPTYPVLRRENVLRVPTSVRSAAKCE